MDLSKEKPSKNVEDRTKEPKKKRVSLNDIAGAIAENAPGGSIPKRPKGWGKASSGW